MIVSVFFCKTHIIRGDYYQGDDCFSPGTDNATQREGGLCQVEMMEIDWWDRLWPDYTDCDEFFRLLVYSIKTKHCLQKYHHNASFVLRRDDYRMISLNRRSETMRGKKNKTISL